VACGIFVGHVSPHHLPLCRIQARCPFLRLLLNWKSQKHKLWDLMPLLSGWHFPGYLLVASSAFGNWTNKQRYIHPRPLNKPAHQLVFNLRILFPTCSISSLLLISIIYLANKQTTGTESKRNRKLADERWVQRKKIFYNLNGFKFNWIFISMKQRGIFTNIYNLFIIYCI